MLQYIAGMIYLAPNISCWLYTCSLQLYDIFGAIMDQRFDLFMESYAARVVLSFLLFPVKMESFVLIFLIPRDFVFWMSFHGLAV